MRYDSAVDNGYVTSDFGTHITDCICTLLMPNYYLSNFLI